MFWFISELLVVWPPEEEWLKRESRLIGIPIRDCQPSSLTSGDLISFSFPFLMRILAPPSQEVEGKEREVTMYVKYFA